MSPLSPEHLEILRSGAAKWNAWRQANPGLVPQLEGAELADAELAGANLARANLDRAELSGADLRGARLVETYLVGANLEGALLEEANLSMCLALAAHFQRARLDGALLKGGNFAGAQFEGASLRGTVLKGAQLDRADFAGADLTGAKVYGVAAWNVTVEREVEDGRLLEACQTDLVITFNEQEEVRVDDLRIAQLIYLVRDNARISDVIQGMSSKAVLLLGRFTPEPRFKILEVIRDKLRSHGLVPIIFNFDRPGDRGLTETVRILTGLSRFVVFDLTDASSVAWELGSVVRDFRIPFVPIIQSSDRPFAMFADGAGEHDHVLETFEYGTKEDVEREFDTAILDRANAERARLRTLKARPLAFWRRPSGG